MPKEVFEQVLRRVLIMHDSNQSLPKKLRDSAIKLHGDKYNWTLSYFDDFYEFLEHWKDYKNRK